MSYTCNTCAATGRRVPAGPCRARQGGGCGGGRQAPRRDSAGGGLGASGGELASGRPPPLPHCLNQGPRPGAPPAVRWGPNAAAAAFRPVPGPTGRWVRRPSRTSKHAECLTNVRQMPPAARWGRRQFLDEAGRQGALRTATRPAHVPAGRPHRGRSKCLTCVRHARRPAAAAFRPVPGPTGRGLRRPSRTSAATAFRPTRTGPDRAGVWLPLGAFALWRASAAWRAADAQGPPPLVWSMH